MNVKLTATTHAPSFQLVQKIQMFRLCLVVKFMLHQIGFRPGEDGYAVVLDQETWL